MCLFKHHTGMSVSEFRALPKQQQFLCMTQADSIAAFKAMKNHTQYTDLAIRAQNILDKIQSLWTTHHN